MRISDIGTVTVYELYSERFFTAQIEQVQYKYIIRKKYGYNEDMLKPKY